MNKEKKGLTLGEPGGCNRTANIGCLMLLILGCFIMFKLASCL